MNKPEDDFVKNNIVYKGTRMLVNDENNRNVDHITYKMMKYIDDEFNNNDIRYVVDAGTLLGTEREGKRIVYDSDIDICVHKEDWNKFIKLTKYKNEEYVYTHFHKLYPQKGFRVLRQRNQNKNKYKFLAADIQKSDHILPPIVYFVWAKLLGNKNTFFNGDYLFNEPLKRMHFGPIDVWTPSSYNINKRLVQWYGEDYMIPRR